MRKSVFIGFIMGLIVVASLSVSSHAQSTMTIAPHLIILNASGSNLDVKCNWSGYMSSGYSILSHEISIYVEGVYICKAYDLSYCWIDHMFKATFDRIGFMTHPAVVAWTNKGIVEASISGTFVTGDQVSISNRVLSPKIDDIEIVQPTGKKGK
jgi:hypothetical protein